MISYFAEVTPDNRYVQCHHVVLPCEAQIAPANPANTLFPVAAPPATWAGKTATEVLHLLDGVEVWVETVSVEQRRLAAIAKTYKDVDAIYDAAVGSRTPEYTEAEAAAKAYLAADVKPSPVSSFITDHAEDNPTGQVQTNEWAAQQIVERADAFAWAVRQMRKARFAHQALIRAATTHEDLNAACASWDEFTSWLRAMLGL